MLASAVLLEEICGLIARHARGVSRTTIEGLLVSRVKTAEPEYSLTEPLLVVMARGCKRLLLGDHVIEHRAGHCLVVTTNLPVTGHFVGASPGSPSLAAAVVLRPAAIASLLLELPARAWSRGALAQPAITTTPASPELLDAMARLLRLIDRPADARVLVPLLEREILWWLLSGPNAMSVAQIGLADSGLAHVNKAIEWIRGNYAEPMPIPDLARLAGMSPSVFHHRFRAVTAMSPLQFQKRIRLQEARALLVAGTDDVARIGSRVGYASPTQFNREYRRLFGYPPGKDAERLRSCTLPGYPARSPRARP
ncbi:MAG: AraC family transcriptional regulator N-terminal domain-containing protein [Trebonia sp.]